MGLWFWSLIRSQNAQTPAEIPGEVADTGFWLPTSHRKGPTPRHDARQPSKTQKQGSKTESEQWLVSRLGISGAAVLQLGSGPGKASNVGVQTEMSV